MLSEFKTDHHDLIYLDEIKTTFAYFVRFSILFCLRNPKQY